VKEIKMRTFQVDDRTFSGYLAEPADGSGPGVVVLHAWWGLTEPFQQVCDRLAEAGFVALAPDLYHGKTTASVEEAEALGAALDQDEERWRGDIAAAIQFLRQREAIKAGGHGKLALVGFSLGDAYALDTSVNLPEEIAAVVVFYGSYPGLDYRKASAAYLLHYAEDDPFEPLSRSPRWSMISGLREGQPPFIGILGPHIGSSRRIAPSIMPRLLALLGSGPSSSCMSGLSKRSRWSGASDST
jgi:carboxymethylenebutenolidase